MALSAKYSILFVDNTALDGSKIHMNMFTN